jgi:hypothetical protein
MARKLGFYNHMHNGDLFAGRGWIEAICKKLDYSPIYYHSNKPQVIADLPVTYQPLPADFADEHFVRHKFIATDDTIWINTWIGAYLSHKSTDGVAVVGGPDCVNYQGFHNMWKFIFSMCNHEFHLGLEISDDLWPFITDPNYSFYNIAPVDDFLQQHRNNKRVLISNGPGHSQQCWQSHDMSHIMQDSIQHCKNLQFIFTHRTPLQYDNVFYTDDITQTPGCDLNEIGYLSHHCDIIIGRSSGPFNFAMTRANLQDALKTFIIMDYSLEHCFPLNMNIPARFYHIDDTHDSWIKYFIEVVVHAQYNFR